MRLQKPADNRVKFNFKALRWGHWNCNKPVVSFEWKKKGYSEQKIEGQEDAVYTVIDFQANFFPDILFSQG